MVQSWFLASSAPAAAAAAAAAVVTAFGSAGAAVLPPAARLHSVHRAPPNAKIVHLVRHAEGHHNVSPDHKTPALLDSSLTPAGVEQCRRLASVTRRMRVDVVISSPLTRCLQTSMYSFESALLGSDGGGRAAAAAAAAAAVGGGREGRGGRENLGRITTPSPAPLVAHEDWRETVNFLCDARRTTSELRASFPFADFSNIRSESDPIWAEYESRHGCYEIHTGLRESKDGPALERRARAAWAAVADRPERHVAVVSHSALFMHMFTPYLEEMMGVVSYEDEEVRKIMTAEMFRNCELRTVAFEAPR